LLYEVVGGTILAAVVVNIFALVMKKRSKILSSKKIADKTKIL